MDVQIKQTNTTEAASVLSHDDIVAVLGLAVKMKAGIASNQAGATVNVKLVPVDGTDQFTAEVDVLVDHNAVAPEPAVAPVADAPASTPAADLAPVASTDAISSGLVDLSKLRA